jgi:hypothetical protein
VNRAAGSKFSSRKSLLMIPLRGSPHDYRQPPISKLPLAADQNKGDWLND